MVEKLARPRWLKSSNLNVTFQIEKIFPLYQLITMLKLATALCKLQGSMKRSVISLSQIFLKYCCIILRLYCPPFVWRPDRLGYPLTRVVTILEFQNSIPNTIFDIHGDIVCFGHTMSCQMDTVWWHLLPTFYINVIALLLNRSCKPLPYW